MILSYLMKPIYRITSTILNQVENIARLVGKLEGIYAEKPQPILRKKNRIRTIHGSVGIEGNALSEEQVTALLNGKRIIGPKKDIQEVVNANQLYETSTQFNYQSEKDFLKAHKVLMKNLISHPGSYRAGNVGIFDKSKAIHIAPKANRVATLMKELFDFLHQNKNMSLLIQAAIFHYEAEFIHPFMDGNGRMGRFWQHLILEQLHPVFRYIPFESMIHQYQKKYYAILQKSDLKGECTDFIGFSLDMILKTLKEFETEVKPIRLTSESRLDKGKDVFKEHFFSRKEYMNLFNGVGTATASRDLLQGVKNKILEKSGSQALTKYRYR